MSAATLVEQSAVHQSQQGHRRGNAAASLATDTRPQDKEPASIPTVTEDDLYTFHALHFRGQPRPHAYFLGQNDAQYDASDPTEEDDGLGWYPDGVKRTLTNEQVEMFRHSEMLEIAREQKLARSARYNSDDEPSTAHETLATNNTIHSPPADAIEMSNRSRIDNSANNDSVPSNQSSSKARRKKVPYQERHKRKWEGYVNQQDPVHGSMTHRRLARDLDGQAKHRVQIDYGDDTTADASHTVDPRSQRRVVRYDDN